MSRASALALAILTLLLVPAIMLWQTHTTAVPRRHRAPSLSMKLYIEREAHAALLSRAWSGDPNVILAYAELCQAQGRFSIARAWLLRARFIASAANDPQLDRLATTALSKLPPEDR